jgi:hypothetical protein
MTKSTASEDQPQTSEPMTDSRINLKTMASLCSCGVATKVFVFHLQTKDAQSGFFKREDNYLSLYCYQRYLVQILKLVKAHIKEMEANSFLQN